jgi:hypothetical protein
MVDIVYRKSAIRLAGVDMLAFLYAVQAAHGGFLCMTSIRKNHFSEKQPKRESTH